MDIISFNEAATANSRIENFIKNQNFTNHKQQLMNGQQELLKGN